MNDKEIFSHVDHTLLKPTASWAEITLLCEEAISYQTASVCVPPAYVAPIKRAYGEQIRICTVIGFPLGYSTTEGKLAEIQQAKADGAVEFDMVVNLGDVKNGDLEKVTKEIKQLKKAVGTGILKVIIETCYLTQEEKIALCKAVTDGGGDYIKTSTGFGTGGAAMADILLFQKHIGAGVKIKASGGIRSRQDMVDFLENGCDRLGTSSAVKLLAGDGIDE